MAVLTGFTRPVQGDAAGNPIIAEDMRTWIVAQTGKTITYVEINSTTIDVTGTIVSGDTSAIQTAINSYIYAIISGVYIPVTQMSNTVPMPDDVNKVVTAHAALMSDLVVAAIPNKVHSGSTIDTGAWPILRKATTNSSGVATIYLTADGTSGTGAAFATIYEDGIVAMPVGANNYNVTGVVISGDKKTMAVTCSQIKTVLGLLTFSSTADAGIEVRAAVWGK